MTDTQLPIDTQLPTLTVWGALPPFAIGFARDLRVRWALEEAGQPYHIHRLSREEANTSAYRARQPFGQMPVFQDQHVTLFESGAILHYLAEDSPALMPAGRAGRAQVLSWMFAALNSFEQDVMGVIGLEFLPGDAEWVAQRRPALEEALEKRLASVETWLAQRDYLVERFSVADILMTWQLKLVENTGALARYPALSNYYRRCTARPAYLKALADHTALYQGAPAQ